MSEQTPYQQNPVSAEVWPWTTPPVVVDPAAGHSIKARLIRWLIPMAIAALFFFGFWKFDSKLVAYIIAGITTTLFVLSFISMPLYHKINGYIFTLAAWLGKIVTWTAMVPFFYLAFPLGRLGGKLQGKDALRRKFPHPGESAWVDRPEVERDDYYETQFSKVARGG